MARTKAVESIGEKGTVERRSAAESRKTAQKASGKRFVQEYAEYKKDQILAMGDSDEKYSRICKILKNYQYGMTTADDAMILLVSIAIEPLETE